MLIGDTTPRSHDGGNNALLQLADNVSGRWARISSTTYIDSTIGGGIILAHSRNGTVGSHTIVQDDDKIGSIFFEGSDGTDFERGAHIEAFVDGTPGDNDMPGRLVFSTTPDGSVTPTERLRITSAGLIGINNTPSGAQFVIKNSDDANLNAITILNDNGNMSASLSQDSSGAGSYLQKDNAGNIKTFIRSYNTSYFLGGSIGVGTDNPACRMHLLAGNDRACIRLENTYDTPDNVWELQPGISGVSNTGFCIRDITDSANRFVIDGSGKIGIGVNAPEVMLDIRANDPGIQLVDTGGTSTYGNIDFVGDTLILTSRGGSSSDGAIDFRRYDGTTLDNSMRIDSAGRVLIGLTSGTQANASIDDLQVGNPNSATQTGITLGSTDESAIAFADAGDARAGSMTYNHGANTMIFKINGQNERFRVDSSGIKVTNSADSTTVATITNNGTTTADCLKLSSGGTGAGTDIFTAHSHNQSSETERFRIQADGNVTIGKTSNLGSGATVGIELFGGGYSMFVRQQNVPMYLGRNTSTGTILSFLYNGTERGKVQTDGTITVSYTHLTLPTKA